MKRFLSGRTWVQTAVGICIAAAIIAGIAAPVLFNRDSKDKSGLGAEYQYDVSGLGRVDPSLIIYHQSGQPVDTGMKETFAVAVSPDGAIYVAGDNQIKIFGGDTPAAGAIKLSDMPRCLTIAGNGCIYVGTKDHVEIFEQTGTQKASWLSLGPNAVLTSIAVYKNDVFVADAGNRVVVRYDTTGRLINYIGKKNPEKNIPGFVIPGEHFDLAVGGDGLLRVANPGRHLIEAYTFGGDREFWWGTASMKIEGFCGCCNPANFSILPDGSYVTAEKGLVRVKIYDTEGKFAGVVAGPEQLFRGGAAHIGETVAESQSAVFDVAADAAGKVYVLDTVKNVVKIFEKDGVKP